MLSGYLRMQTSCQSSNERHHPKTQELFRCFYRKYREGVAIFYRMYEGREDCRRRLRNRSRLPMTQ